MSGNLSSDMKCQLRGVDTKWRGVIRVIYAVYCLRSAVNGMRIVSRMTDNVGEFSAAKD